VAERDPMLFQQLVRKIRVGRKSRSYTNV